MAKKKRVTMSRYDSGSWVYQLTRIIFDTKKPLNYKITSGIDESGNKWYQIKNRKTKKVIRRSEWKKGSFEAGEPLWSQFKR
jgi:hypothetical protein